MELLSIMRKLLTGVMNLFRDFYEDLMTEDDFLNSTPFDISEIKRVFLALTQPKKKTDLENRS